jgi:hypothetical protein
MMRKSETGASVRVIELPVDRLAEAAGVLARRYQDHPNSIDFFPDEKVRALAFPHVCTAGLRDALGFRHVYAGMRGGEVVGFAAWLPPGAFPLTLERLLRVAPDMTRILATARRSILRLVRFMAGVNKVHPAQPYWYLEVVGVDPGARGRRSLTTSTPRSSRPRVRVGDASEERSS